MTFMFSNQFAINGDILKIYSHPAWFCFKRVFTNNMVKVTQTHVMVQYILYITPLEYVLVALNPDFSYIVWWLFGLAYTSRQLGLRTGSGKTWTVGSAGLPISHRCGRCPGCFCWTQVIGGLCSHTLRTWLFENFLWSDGGASYSIFCDDVELDALHRYKMEMQLSTKATIKYHS